MHTLRVLTWHVHGNYLLYLSRAKVEFVLPVDPARGAGGFDEAFVGWGGEDNEFWERASTQRLWPYGGLPLLHLWHPAQAGKHQSANETAARYRELSAIPAHERIRTLATVERGNLAGPLGWARSAQPAG